MLQAAGLAVDCIASGIDESVVVSSDPVMVATTLASMKAKRVAADHPGAFVLGADQVVFDGAEVFGKPTDPADHLRRLRSMRGNSHDLVTAFALVAPDGTQHIDVERTTLRVRADLTDAELRAYVDSGEGSGCAGGYAVEGHGAWLFEGIDGDWFNVVGLPLFKVLSALRAHGFRYPGVDV